jgi:hypothetical protein
VGGERQPGRAARGRDVKAGDFSVQAARRSRERDGRAAQGGIESMAVADERSRRLSPRPTSSIPETGEVILEANEELTPRVISMAQEKKVDKIEVFFPERDDVGRSSARR